MSVIVLVAQSDTVVTDTAFGGLFAAWMAFVVVLSVLGLVALGLCIWNIVDAARRPDYQFEQSGQSKVLWILLPVLGIAVCQLIGVVAPIIYFTSIRKKLDAVPPMPVGPYPGGYQPGYPAAYPYTAYPQPPYQQPPYPQQSYQQAPSGSAPYQTGPYSQPGYPQPGYPQAGGAQDEPQPPVAGGADADGPAAPH